MIDSILNKLKTVKGLSNFIVLDEKTKFELLRLEEKENLGVRACLEKHISLVLTHDSNFRKPVRNLVENTSEGIIFPSQPFPELENAWSACPSIKIHNFLVKKFKLNINEDHATLIIGIDLKES